LAKKGPKNETSSRNLGAPKVCWKGKTRKKGGNGKRQGGTLGKGPSPSQRKGASSCKSFWVTPPRIGWKRARKKLVEIWGGSKPWGVVPGKIVDQGKGSGGLERVPRQKGKALNCEKSGSAGKKGKYRENSQLV